MSEISRLAELRKLLLEMEHTMGLQDLSSVERDVFYAATDLAAPATPVKSTSLQSHALLSSVSRPTFFRALKSLVGKGYLTHCHPPVRGQYHVSHPK